MLRPYCVVREPGVRALVRIEFFQSIAHFVKKWRLCKYINLNRFFSIKFNMKHLKKCSYRNSGVSDKLFPTFWPQYCVFLFEFFYPNAVTLCFPKHFPRSRNFLEMQNTLKHPPSSAPSSVCINGVSCFRIIALYASSIKRQIYIWQMVSSEKCDGSDLFFALGQFKNFRFVFFLLKKKKNFW